LRKEVVMTESVYKIIELVGTSPDSWEAAAKNAVETAGTTLKDLRIAEVIKLDMKVEEGKLSYRVRLNVSFKYEK
jgi:flavin-binding protein dodecin